MKHAYICEMDLALTYSMSHPKLAQRCAMAAMLYAQEMRNPALTYAANNLLALVSM